MMVPAFVMALQKGKPHFAQRHIRIAMLIGCSMVLAATGQRFTLELRMICIYNVNSWSSNGIADKRHIARHGITPEESEEAVLIEPLEAGVQQHEGEARVLCFGRTKSGRLLTVLYTERHGKIRVVTAYEMTKEQQALYFEGI